MRDGKACTTVIHTTRRTLLIFLLAAGALVAAAVPAGAGIYDMDVEPSHVFIYDGPAHSSDGAGDVVMGSGVTFVAGSSRSVAGAGDAALTRISHASWTATTVTYDSKYHLEDYASDVALGPDGSVYTTGYSANATNDDLLLVKWSKAGKFVWARRYNGPVKGRDYGTDIAVDRDGNLIVCGYSEGTNSFDWVVVSWTKKGVRRWTWRYDGSGQSMDRAEELLLDKDGRIYVCGSAWVTGGKPAAAVAKLSRSGAKLWVKTYTGPEARAASVSAIAADPRGGVLVGGWADTAARGWEAMVLRYSPTGSRTAFPLVNMGADTGPDALTDLAVTKVTRTVVGVGYRGTTPSTLNPLTVRYSLEGAHLSSSQTVSASGSDRWLAVAPDAYGGFVKGGMIGPDTTAVYTRRESTLPGTATWESRWDGPVAGIAVAGAVAARGNVAVSVGQCNGGAGSSYDQVVLFWVY